MVCGNEAVSAYGNNMMRNYTNFRTIVDNKIIVTLQYIKWFDLVSDNW